MEVSETIPGNTLVARGKGSSSPFCQEQVVSRASHPLFRYSDVKYLQLLLHRSTTIVSQRKRLTY